MRAFVVLGIAFPYLFCVKCNVKR